MNTEIKNIEFGESYLLGWKFEDATFLLYTELLLTENHPNWEEFDSNQEFGCYKLTVIKFKGVSNIVGIDSDFHLPELNKNLPEYKEYSEINSFEVINHNAFISLDTGDIKVSFSELNLEILNSKRFM